MKDELYVVCKLSSGEQVMAVFVGEDTHNIEIHDPVVIKTTSNYELQKEMVTAHPFCQFSDDTKFIISKKDVMFVKRLHAAFIPQYKRIVEESENITFTARDAAADRYEGLETAEEARKAIEMLEEIFGTDETEEEKPEIRNFVKGNNTIN